MKSSTSAKFFSAWIPPAVAQAPIVTRRFESARTSLIRSASCAFVTEPSTSERSYGPSTRAAPASRKYAMSISPASASSSSSQSRSESWQPSQDANFQTARVGFSFTARAPPAGARARPRSRPGRRGRSGSGRAGSGRTSRAPQRMLRSIDRWIRSGGTPALQQGLDREPHHDLRPDDERGGGRRVEARGRDQLRDDADLAAPVVVGGVDGDVELQLAGPAVRARR